MATLRGGWEGVRPRPAEAAGPVDAENAPTRSLENRPEMRFSTATAGNLFCSRNVQNVSPAPPTAVFDPRIVRRRPKGYQYRDVGPGRLPDTRRGTHAIGS